MIELLLAVNLEINKTKIPTLKAEFYCSDVTTITRTLDRDYGEEPVVLGRGKKDDGMLVIYRNADNSTWTLLAVYPDKACIIGTGEQLIIRDNQNKY